VNVYFDDGRIKLFDAKPLIKKGGIFAPLADIDFFKERCSVLNHTLAWDIKGDLDATECIDICPDVIYDGSFNAI
jgi:hypothetical protein